MAIFYIVEVLTVTPDLCNSLEDLSEAEKRVELLPISVQQLLILCRLGKLEDAEKLLAEIRIME